MSATLHLLSDKSKNMERNVNKTAWEFIQFPNYLKQSRKSNSIVFFFFFKLLGSLLLEVGNGLLHTLKEIIFQSATSYLINIRSLHVGNIISE